MADSYRQVASEHQIESKAFLGKPFAPLQEKKTPIQNPLMGEQNVPMKRKRGRPRLIPLENQGTCLTFSLFSTGWVWVLAQLSPPNHIIFISYFKTVYHFISRLSENHNEWSSWGKGQHQNLRFWRAKHLLQAAKGCLNRQICWEQRKFEPWWRQFLIQKENQRLQPQIYSIRLWKA